MDNLYLPEIDLARLKAASHALQYDIIYDMLVVPLHEELYRRQTFDFMDELSQGQQLLLGYDYLRTQVGQGGFIQFIQNGYILFLPDMIAQLYMVGANEMAEVLDDVLKVYVLNYDTLSKAVGLQAFAKLYEEFTEFEVLDKRYEELNKPTEQKMLDYALNHLSQFARNA
ncbi:MAG: DUF4375 domain-containing protein [Chitinophagia bacterium]|nr:DUF4375 domain-containing protein [Chitinophagia bacterium]